MPLACLAHFAVFERDAPAPGALARGGIGGIDAVAHLSRAVEHATEVAAVAIGEGMKKTVLTVEQHARAGEASLRHARSAIARLRRPTRMHALGPGHFREVFDDARGHAAGDAQRIEPL